MTWFVVAGLLIGVVHYLASPRAREVGLTASLLIGVLGAVTGGMVAHMLVTDVSFELKIIGTVLADAGSLTILRSAEGERSPSSADITARDASCATTGSELRLS
jgi:uncharacterized membrane protein YeaQ/YmgE (transglycosylase-associated protein family)